MKFRFSTLLIAICLLSNIQGFAHKDKMIQNNYGNVKTFLRTGFDYSETLKMTVIGKLSNELASKLNFKDTLLIEYINDYTRRYKNDFYSFENNNTNFRFAAGLENFSKMSTNGKGVSISIHAKSIDIEKILKLVEYSIVNRKKLHSKLVTQNVKSNYGEELSTDGFLVKLIPAELFKSIISERSDLISKISHTRINLYEQNHYGIEVFWQDNKFIFEYKNFNRPKDFLFEIRDFYYFKEVDLNTMLVFVDGKSFYFLDAGEKTEEKLFYLDNESYRPAEVLNKFKDKIIISNDYDSFNLFLKDKKKVISRFE